MGSGPAEFHILGLCCRGLRPRFQERYSRPGFQQGARFCAVRDLFEIVSPQFFKQVPKASGQSTYCKAFGDFPQKPSFLLSKLQFGSLGSNLLLAVPAGHSRFVLPLVSWSFCKRAVFPPFLRTLWPMEPAKVLSSWFLNPPFLLASGSSGPRNSQPIPWALLVPGFPWPPGFQEGLIQKPKEPRVSGRFFFLSFGKLLS